MKAFTNKAIVIGSSHINTLGTIRSLGEMGVPVYAIITGTKGNFLEGSRYLKDCWSVARTEEAILDVLLNYMVKDRDNKTVVILTNDFCVTVVDKNLEKLKDYYIVPNIGMKADKIVSLMNKEKMRKEAIAVGLDVPKSWLIEFDNAYKEQLKEVEFPCMVKPLDSVEGKKSDIKKIEAFDELEVYLSSLSQVYRQVLIQEYIGGKDSKMLEMIGFVALSGHTYMPGVLDKIRQYPPELGSTSFGIMSDKKYGIDFEKVQAFFEKINFRGIWDVEFKFANGRTVFIEVNYRNGGLNYLYTVGGANISYLWYLDACGYDISDKLKDAKKKIVCMYGERDFRNIFKKEVSVVRWVKDFLRTDAFTVYNRHDMRPFFMRLKNIFFKRLLHLG